MQITLIGSEGTLDLMPFTELILAALPVNNKEENRVETNLVLPGKFYTASERDTARIIVFDGRAAERELIELNQWYAHRVFDPRAARGPEKWNRPTALLFLSIHDYCEGHDCGNSHALLLLLFRHHLPEDVVHYLAEIFYNLIVECRRKAYSLNRNIHRSADFCDSYGLKHLTCRVYSDRNRLADMFVELFSDSHPLSLLYVKG